VTAPNGGEPARSGGDQGLMYQPTWRVMWCDWREHHDWIGREPIPGGRTPGNRRLPLPMRHAQDVLYLETALALVAELRQQVGEDDLVVQVIELLADKDSPLPPEQLLLGDWPLQRRGEVRPW
jgi:hypothetical protein